MPTTNVTRRAGALLSLLATSLYAIPASAAEDRRSYQHEQSRRAAFAGASFRLDLGARASRPATRLQLGMRSVGGDRRSAGALDTRQVPVLELGIGGREKGDLFVAGQSTAEIEHRLRLTSGTSNTVWLVFGAALVVVGVIVITNLDGLDTDD